MLLRLLLFSARMVSARNATTHLKLFTSKVLVQLRVNDVMHRAASTRLLYFLFCVQCFIRLAETNRRDGVREKPHNNIIRTVYALLDIER